MDYNEILAQVIEIRSKSWDDGGADVPLTRQIGEILGESISLQLKGRDIRVIYHCPKTKKDIYPVYFNCHGGGMSAGNVEMDEFLCKAISENVGCIVVNIDYRLAPENPFPEGLNDVYDTIMYMINNSKKYKINTKKVAIGGQSAGANLAISTSIMANRSKEFHYDGVVSCYAALKFFEYEQDEIPKGAIKKKTSKIYSVSYAAGGKDMHDPLASPLCASKEDIRDTPSIMIIAAELDGLRKDSEIYAKMLMDQGIPVLYKQFMNCVHGFTHRDYEKEPKEAIDIISRYLEGIWK